MDLARIKVNGNGHLMYHTGSGLNEVCLAQPFKITTTLHRHISFKPLLCVCKIFNNYFLCGLLTD